MALLRPLTGLALGLSTLLWPGPTTAADGYGLHVGDRFPDLVLPSLSDGEPLSIRSFRGQKVAMHVWASW